MLDRTALRAALGIRHKLDTGKLQPYLGGGIDLLQAIAEEAEIVQSVSGFNYVGADTTRIHEERRPVDLRGVPARSWGLFISGGLLYGRFGIELRRELTASWLRRDNWGDAQRYFLLRYRL